MNDQDKLDRELKQIGLVVLYLAVLLLGAGICLVAIAAKTQAAIGKACWIDANAVNQMLHSMQELGWAAFPFIAFTLGLAGVAIFMNVRKRQKTSNNSMPRG